MDESGNSKDSDKGYWEARKLEWEAKKLEVDVAASSKNIWQKSNFWFSAIPAVAAVFGIGLQWYASSLDYKKAEVLREQAKLEETASKQQAAAAKEEAKQAEAIREQALAAARLAQSKLKAVQSDLEEKRKQIEVLVATTAELEQRRNERNRELASLQRSIEQIRNQKVDQQMLGALEKSIDEFQKRQVEVNSKAQEQSQIVQKLGGSKK